MKEKCIKHRKTMYNIYHCLPISENRCVHRCYIFRHLACGQASNLTLQRGRRNYISNEDKLSKSVQSTCMCVGDWWGMEESLNHCYSHLV